MEYHLIHWYSIGEMHLIIGQNISVGFRLSWGLVHWSDWYQWNNI